MTLWGNSRGTSTMANRNNSKKSLLDSQTTSGSATLEPPERNLNVVDVDAPRAEDCIRPPVDVKIRRKKPRSKKSLSPLLANPTPSESTAEIPPSMSKASHHSSSVATHTGLTTTFSSSIIEASNTRTKEESRHPSPTNRSLSRSIRNSKRSTAITKQAQAIRSVRGGGGGGSKASVSSHPSTDGSTASAGAAVSVAASRKTTTTTGSTAVSDLKLSSERLEVLVMQLRETNDEKEAATIVLEFALRIKNHELVVQGADLSIINAMRRFSNSSKIQTRGCKALAEMACKGLPNIESIIDKGGSEVILKAMEKHRAEEDLQKEACRAIECITHGSNQGKQSFGLNGKDAIVSILHSMGDHPNSAKLQRLACKSLSSIAENHADCSQCIVSKGGLDVIRKTLKYHDDNTEVIEAAFDILINMSSAVNKCSLDEEIAMTVSLDRILATMLLYRKNEKMQSQGMALLCILCKTSPRNRAKVASRYGLEVVTKSLETCALNKDVQRHGTTLIQNLCQSEGNAVAAGLVSEGGMELLLNVLRRHGSDAIIVQQIFLIIAKMARPFSDKIRKEGGIELILSGMRRHEENINVQEAACLALWKLSSKTENANIINGNGGVSLINAALARFPKDEGISEVACEALASLSHDKQILIAQQTLKARAAATAAHKKPESSWGSLNCGVSCF